MSFLDSLGKTLKSLGGAAVAPVTTVYDIAKTPFDSHDDDLESYVHILSHGVSNSLDPLSNPDTWTGYAVGHTMHALDWTWKHTADPVLGTAAGIVGTGKLNPTDWGDVWNAARKTSFGHIVANVPEVVPIAGPYLQTLLNHQTKGASQRLNPLAPDTYSKLHKKAPFLTGATSFGSEFAAQWYLDPGVLALKGAGLGRAIQMGKLTEAKRGVLGEQLFNGPDPVTGLRRFVPTRSMQTRSDQFNAYILGDNPLKRPLGAKEILAASPEIRDSAQGGDIADLMAQAVKMDAPLDDKVNALRRITAVAGGDQTQIIRLQDEIPQAKAIADALSNINNRSTVQLTLQELNADSKYSPELLGDMQRQLDNLDAEGDVTRFVNDWLGKKESEAAKLLDVSGELNHLPGAHGTVAPLRYIPGPQGASDKALLRQHGLNGLNRLAKLGPGAEKIAKDRVNGSSTLWQKSLNQVPLLVAKAGDAFTAPYLKLPAAADNALRQTHYIGVANLHDWSGATDQLDSMLRLMGANDAERLGALDKAFSARSELDKRTAIRHVEKVAMRAFAAKMTAKFGHHIDQDYIENLLSKGHYDTDRLMNSLQGVAYSATQMPEDMLLRQRGLTNLADQSKVEARVDQFLDENGVPTALPLLESQLANKVPLLDAHLLTKTFARQEKVKQLSDLSRSWKDEALDLTGLGRRFTRAKAGEKQAIARLLQAKYATMDALSDAGQLLTRGWKYSVLLRLGYPQRVLMDDNARIFAVMHSANHFFDNGAEATKAWWHNRAPGFINSNGRKAFAARRYAQARNERSVLQNEYGYDKPHSDEEFDKITEAARTLTKRRATATDKGMAQATLDKLDPEGHVSEYYQKVAEIAGLRRSNSSLERNITKMQAELDGGLEGEAASELRRKIALAKHRIDDNNAGIDFKQSSLPEMSPDDTRKALRNANDLLISGPKVFRENKRTLGQAEVNLDLPGVDPVTGKPWAAYGAFAGPYGDAYKASASSAETYHQVISDGEERAYNAAKTGLWRTIDPKEPGHVHAWADVINHQVRNSAVGMWHAKHPNGTLEEFETWLADPARQHLRERLPYLAHDTEGWYHRTKALVDDVLSHDEVRQAALDGRVSVNRLRKVDVNERPAVHGAAIDFNTGRHVAARMTGNAMNGMMRWLSETPTDKLSRQPFFNTIYKREVREMARLRHDAAAKMGRQFSEEDLRFVERQARKKALNAVKSYLWDISAHSNAAHMLRFISPFFAAHQEALNRWWRIAKEDPSVVRRFQMAFDAPRKMGLVYDSTTGEPIKPGESISSQHRILLRVPWAGDDSGINRWLRKLGGDRYWSINENGLNTLLQGGLTNPGTGPMVSLPAGVFAHKYADDPEILKAANILTSGYIPDTPADAILPAWAAKAKSLATHDGRYDSQFTANMQDRLTQFIQANGRTPNDAEFDSIMRMAGQKTNRDLVMMGLSNIVSLTPARPDSKYAVIQEGFARLRKQADAEGHDSQWLFDQFDKKYGSIYDVLIASSSANPAKLTGSPAEVAAVKKYKSLLAKVDPLVARTVIGPEAAKGGPAATAYNPISRQSLESMRLTPGSNDTLIESKDPRQIALGALEDQGWDQYDQLTNWLTVTAKQAGLKSYYDSPQLMALKSAGLKNILNNNFAFRNAWVQASTGDQYDKYLDDLREVAKSKSLNDTARPDIAYLKQYLQVRDWVTENLKARKAAGGSDSPDSSENSALMQFFTNYTLSLADKSTYFQNYIFNGLVERDPYLLATQLAVTK